MDVAGSADQLAELLPQFYDFPVQIPQFLLCLHRTFFIPQHKSVIADGLNFQIVVKPNQSGNF